MSTPGNFPWQAPNSGAPGPPTFPQVPPQRPGIPQSVAVPVPTQPSYPGQLPNAPVPMNVVPASAVPMSVAPVAARPVPVPVRPQPIPVSTVAAPAQNRPLPVQPTTAAPTVANNRPLPVSARPIPVKPKGEMEVVAEDDKDAEEKPKTLEELVTPLTTAPWLVSTIVHIIIVLILAFIFFPRKQETHVDIEVVYAEAIGEQLQNDVLDMGVQDPNVTEAAFAIDMKQVDDPLAAPPQISDIVPDSVGMTSDMQVASIGLALSGREKGAKKALLGAYGGTESTEASVKLGLEWLERNQQKDGTWSLIGPYDGGAGTENTASATAMALLAFQGAGHTPTQGDFKKTVEKGWKALLAMQDREGNFVKDAGFNHMLYSQAQCTIAICELYGMTKDSKYGAAAELAVAYALKAQAPEGGWRYNPGQDTDTSVTGWFVMALQSAKMAGMKVPDSSFDNITKWLDAVQSDDGSRYRYQRGREFSHTMTAEALLCRQYLGWKRNDERLVRGADLVVAQPLDYGEQNVYYWYYATQMVHHMEGEHWQKWNSVMRQAVPSHQQKSGKEKGSWSPDGDEWGHHGGRLYVTCLSIYLLEVYYRHLPLYSGAAIR